MQKFRILFVLLFLFVTSSVFAEPLVPVPPAPDQSNFVAGIAVNSGTPELVWPSNTAVSAPDATSPDAPSATIWYCSTNGELVQETPHSPLYMRAYVGATCFDDGPLEVYVSIRDENYSRSASAHNVKQPGYIYFPWANLPTTVGMEYTVFAAPIGMNYAVGSVRKFAAPVIGDIPYTYTGLNWDGKRKQTSTITTETEGDLYFYEVLDWENPNAFPVKVNGSSHTQGDAISGTVEIEMDAIPERFRRFGFMGQIEYDENDDSKTDVIAVIPYYALADKDGCFVFSKDPRTSSDGVDTMYVTSFTSCLPGAFVLIYDGFGGAMEGAAILPEGTDQTIATKLEPSSAWVFINVYFKEEVMLLMDGVYDLDPRSNPPTHAPFISPVKFHLRSFTQKGNKFFYKAKIEATQNKVRFAQLWEFQFHGGGNAPTLEAMPKALVNGLPYQVNQKLARGKIGTVKAPLTAYYNIAAMAFLLKGVWVVEMLDHYGFAGVATSGIVKKMKKSAPALSGDWRN